MHEAHGRWHALASTQATSSTTYDELGLARSSTDFGGVVTAGEFDRSGHATRTFEDLPGGPAVVTGAVTYDADGKALTSHDRRQISEGGLGFTSFGYDGFGRHTDTIEAAGTFDESTTSTGYDPLRRSSLTVGGQETLYAHDLGGRVIETDDGFTCATAQHDYRGLATETVNGLVAGCSSGAEQRTTEHTYDALGRATYSEVIAGVGDGDVPLDDAYDAVGNRRSSAVNGEPATITTQNLLDQMVTEGRTDGSIVKATYDAAGNALDQCSWTAGATVSNCLTAGDYPWTNPPTQVTSAVYDARNQRVSLEDPVRR